MKYENFELTEFVKSDTADRNGIDNTPTFEAVAHLGELVGGILQPLRTAWGKPIRVTSGYRCPELNKAVKGSSTSAHQDGYAADIQPEDMKQFPSFCSFLADFVKKQGIKYDQIITEKSSTAEWVHIGVRNHSGEQRMQSLSLQV